MSREASYLGERMMKGPNKAVRLLVVDDHPLVREQMARWLGDNGYWIALAVDGEDAINRLAVEAFDAVLSDVQMPRMDGFELLVQVQRRYPLLPVVLMTAMLDPHKQARASQSAAVALLEKPFEIEQLRAALLPALSMESQPVR